MSTYYHRIRLRREERQAAIHHSGLNLVPLVDILTSIVFFSLLTYAGAALAALTSFDLTLPPTVLEKPADAKQLKQEKDVLNLLLVVRVFDDRVEIEHSANGGFRKPIAGVTAASLDTFEQEMVALRTQFPANSDVLVVPADGLDYETLVHVLERLKRARYSGISLGTRERKVTP